VHLLQALRLHRAVVGAAEQLVGDEAEGHSLRKKVSSTILVAVSRNGMSILLRPSS